MFKRGFACCVLLALASTAYGGVEIQLVPNPGPPYDGGESVIVDVLLVQTPAGTDRSLRMVQLDFTNTELDNWGVLPDFWDFSSTQHCIDVPADCGAGYTIDEDKSAALPPAANVYWIVYGSEFELGENTDNQVILPGDGTPVLVGQLDATVPSVDGHHLLSVMNGFTGDMDMGAQVHWGFGSNINTEPLTAWRPSTGTVTGGEYDFCVGTGGDGAACVVTLVLPTAPPCDNVLPRFTNNVLRLTFSGPISAPAAGEVEIRELQAAGGFGSDLSSQFIFTVEGTDVLRIEENGDVLADGTWYGITNTAAAGGWPGVADFQVDYVVVVGDVSNDGFNDFSDLSAIFANQTGAAEDDDPYDVNADGFVDFSDLSAAFGFNGSFDPGKPGDHGCVPEP
jgi:hypothetical protein